MDIKCKKCRRLFRSNFAACEFCGCPVTASRDELWSTGRWCWYCYHPDVADLRSCRYENDAITYDRNPLPVSHDIVALFADTPVAADVRMAVKAFYVAFLCTVALAWARGSWWTFLIGTALSLVMQYVLERKPIADAAHETWLNIYKRQRSYVCLRCYRLTDPKERYKDWRDKEWDRRTISLADAEIDENPV